MLKIFDKDHNAIGHIVKYKDCKIESEVATGDKTLSFVYLENHHRLMNEMYVQTQEDEYVIKEVPASTGSFPQIVAVLNLEDLQKDMWQTFTVADMTIDAAVRTVLAGTGWTIGTCDVMKKRNAGMMQVSTLDVIQNLCTAFMCEPVFDTIQKTVSFYNRRGEDRGTYFMSGLNLKKLQKTSTSYDYYTRMIPIGQDGLDISQVNDGKNYLENYQYSNKVLTYIWKDESYTDAQALKEDAERKLEDMSKPTVAYSVEVRDLAAQKKEYSILSYGEGDTVKLIDQETGTMVKQRIKKLVRYLDHPEKNTCEIANTILTFEEMQQKYKEASDIINFTVTGDGRYTGTIHVSDILKFEQGIAGSSTIGSLNNAITTINGEVANVKLIAGEIKANYLAAEEAELKYALITELDVVRENVHNLNADYGAFKTVTTEELTAHTARMDTIIGDLADYRKVVAEELTAAKGWMTEGAIGNAQISSMDANKLTAGTIDTAMVSITGTDGRLRISDNTIQINDASRVRVQIGKDDAGEYSMSVWDVSGKIIWDALGATEHTIQRKIIRDSIVADDAAIQALKIDFQSFDTALTEQEVTISGTVVQVGSKNLNVVLSEQTQIVSSAKTVAEEAQKIADTNAETLITHASQITANEKAIALKVSSQTYEKDKADVESSLQSMESSVNVMNGRITALVSDVTVLRGDCDGLESRTGKLEMDASNFAVQLSSTQKTVSDNYESLKQYTDSAVDEIQIGGRNLLLNSGKEYSNDNYPVASYIPSAPLVERELYTVSLCVTPAPNVNRYKVYVSSGYSGLCSLLTDGTTNKQIISETFYAAYASGRTPDDNSIHANITIFRHPNDGTVTENSTIHWIKIESGNKATDWTPAPEDVDSAIATIDGKFASYTTTVEMQSAITVAKDEISLAVSEKYTTKDKMLTIEEKTSTIENDLSGIRQTVSQVQTDLEGTRSEVTSVTSALGSFEVKVAETYATNSDFKALEDTTNTFIGTANAWEMKWEKIFSASNAQENIYRSYITFDTGTMLLGNSINDTMLKLGNESIQFLRKDGTEVASFKPNSIAIGKDSTSSVIDLCAGTGQIVNANPNAGYKRLLLKSTDSVEIDASKIVKLTTESDTASATIGMNSGKVPWDSSYDDSVEDGSIILRSTTTNYGGATSKLYLHPTGFEYVTPRSNMNVLYDTMWLTLSTVDMRTNSDSRLLVNNLYANNLLLNSGNGGSYLDGMTSNKCIVAPQQTGDKYHPVIRIPSSSGHVWNIGGIGDDVGIYGYCSWRTENGYDFRTKWNMANGNLYHDRNMYVGNLFHSPWQGHDIRASYRIGDSFEVFLQGSGYITSSGKKVYFTIPLAIPVVSCNSISVTSVNGLIIRQGNKYLYGSTASNYVIPSSYSGTISTTDNNFVRVSAEFNNTTNVVSNNDPCGIEAWIRITIN